MTETIINPDGTFAEGWQSSISEEFRDTDIVKNAKDLNGVISQAVNHEKALGGRVKVPTAEDDADAWKKFYSKVPGIPETPEAYSYKPSLPEGMKSDGVFEKTMRNAAKQANITDVQFSHIAKIYDDLTGAAFTAQSGDAKKVLAASKEKIKTEWGADFDKNSEIARRGYEALAPEGFEEILATEDIFDDPFVAKLAFNAGLKLIDDGDLVKGEQKANPKTDGRKYPKSPGMYSDKTD